MIGRDLIRWHGILWAFAALSSVAPGSDLSYSDLVQRLEYLEQKVASQQREIFQFQQAGYPLNGARIGGFLERDAEIVTKLSGYEPNRRHGGPYAVVECTALKPYVSSVNFGLGHIGLDAEYKTGVRFVLGYEGRSGLGFRTRYWTYDQDFPGPGQTPPTNNYGINMDVADAETTFRGEFCNWQMQVAGGLRYGRSELNRDFARAYYEGVGVTVALDASRPVFRHWSFVGGFRGSLLVGRIRGPAMIPGPPPLITDEATQIWEIRLGCEYRRAFRFGEFAFQALWEHQDWENNAGPNLALSPVDMALAGPVFRIEFRR